MARIFDTHCHLFMEPLAGDINSVLARAFSAGIARMLVPSVSSNDWDACTKLSLLPGISCALGIHPWQAEEGIRVEELREKLISTGAAAVGEIGLDWKVEVSRQTQYTVFRDQLKLASEMGIPVSLHCRGAFEEMLLLLKEYPVNGVVHAWSRDHLLMNRFLEAGLFISFGGAVTRPEAKHAQESARKVPINRFVIETDSPSIGLAGVPSGDSEPRHAARVMQAIAEIRSEKSEDTAAAAWENSVALFGETA
jgi:TatD DNase family protein